MQPFNTKNLYALLLAAAAYFSCYFMLNSVNGWLGIFLRSAIFSGIMIVGTFYLKLTPDALQLLDNLKKRFDKNK